MLGNQAGNGNNYSGGSYTVTAPYSIYIGNNAGKVNLIVSHGIFSKGIEALHNIDHIYTTDSFSDLDANDKLTQIKLEFK